MAVFSHPSLESGRYYIDLLALCGAILLPWTNDMLTDDLQAIFIHRRLMDQLCLIPNLSKLKRTNVAFFEFGDKLEWPLGRLKHVELMFPYGGVISLTKEFLVSDEGIAKLEAVLDGFEVNLFL